MYNVLYVFGGEQASGAEIVLERLMSYNSKVNAHLFISPGRFADTITSSPKNYKITIVHELKKLKRSNTNKFTFLIKALNNYLSVSYQVLKYARRNNINVIHANTVVPATYLIPALIISKVFFYKYTWIWSDHDLKYFSRIDAVFSKINCRLYSLTLVVSDAVKRKYSSLKSSLKVHTLYNGLDTDFFKPDLSLRIDQRKKWGFDESIMLFGIAGVISKRKGQLQLIESFVDLSNTYPNIHLIVAGGVAEDEPEYVGETMKLIENYKDRITYLGQVGNMKSFYNGCDVLINNSNVEGSEPLGTTIYEAMACEKVVVASNTGGTPEIIRNKIDGFTFEAGSAKEMKSILGYIVESPASLSEIKSMARKKATSKFTIDKMSRDYNAIIDRTVTE